MRRATLALWALASVAELLLLARAIAMAAVGDPVTGHDVGSRLIAQLYAVTELGVTPLITVGNTRTAGTHVVDTAAILAMDILFFSVLAVTKIALAAARGVERSAFNVQRLQHCTPSARGEHDARRADSGNADPLCDAAQDGELLKADG